MKYEVRDFSKQAFTELVESKRRFLIGDVGSGKTALILAAACFREEYVAKTFPLLVISYATVSKSTWIEESSLWDDFRHLSIISLSGDDLSRMEALHRGADIYTISFNLVPWLLGVPGALQLFRNIIIDESTRLAGLHAFWRGGKVVIAGAKQAQSIARFCLNGKNQWVVEATGTPIARGFHALYGQMFLMDGCKSLGVSNYSAFQQKYLKPSFFGSTRLVPQTGAVEEAMKRIAKHTSQLDVEEEYPDLPKPVEEIVFIDLPKDIKKQYNKLETEALMSLDGIATPLALSAGNISQKLSQFASGFHYVSDTDVPKQWEHKRTGKTLIFDAHDVKRQALLKQIEKIGRPTIIVYYHKGSKEKLEQLGVKFISSATVDLKKQWDAGKIKLLGLHWQTGYGLSLQYGGYDMIFYDIFWSGELLKQTIARIGSVRQWVAGFKRAPNIYYMVTKGTVDEIALDVARGRLSIDQGAVEVIRRLRHAQQS